MLKIKHNVAVERLMVASALGVENGGAEVFKIHASCPKPAKNSQKKHSIRDNKTSLLALNSVCTKIMLQCIIISQYGKLKFI
jgi:hypothetical protein